MAKQQNSNPLNNIYSDLGLESAGVSFSDFENKFNSDSNLRRQVYSDLGLEKAGIGYDIFESRLKKKEPTNVSKSTSQPFAGGLTPSQSFQVSTEQPAVLTPKGEQRYKASRAKEQEQLNTAVQAYKANNTPEDNLSVERASQISARNQLQSAISKDVDNQGNLGGYLYNKVLQGAGSAVSGLIDLGIVGFQGLKNPNPAALISSIPETEETLKDYRTNYAPQVRNFLRENIGANVDLGKEREFDEGFVTGAIGGLAYSAPAMVTPYGVGMFTQAYDSGLNAIGSTPEGKNLSEAEKTLFAGATGLIIGGLEKAGLDKIVGKSRANVSNRILLGALDSIVEAGEKVTSEGLEKAVNQQIKTISRSLPQIVRGTTQSLGTGAKVEALTEFTQELGTVGLERLTNYIKDKEIFDEQSVGETFGRLLKSLGQGAIGGGLLGGIVGGVQTLAPNVDAELTARIVNSQTQQDLDAIVKDIRDIAVENGYAEEQAQLLSERVSKLLELNSKLPSDFTPEERAVVIPAIEERDAITEEINTKTKSLENIDEAFRAEEEAKIQALESRRQELNQQIANPEVTQLNINQDAVKEGNIQQGGEQQREGVVSQEQGQQEDRLNQEEPINQAETTPSSGNSTVEGGQEQVISTQSNNINDTTRQGETTEVNGTVTESLPVGETVETADTTAIQEDVISNTTFWQDLTESDKRATRIKTIEDRLSKFKSSRSNLSIAQDPKEQAKYMRDLTELAILKIADGTVKTAKAFSDMVKGYGFTQDNIDKAYNAAVESAKKYSETNPDQLLINEREGELVVNFQQPKEAQATTKVGAGKVKELTEGGIKGKVTITNKQALKSQIQTLNRGIREGIKQQKEKGNKEANVLSEAKKKVSDWIESFKQTDYFKGKAIPNSVVARLASRALAVKNVNQLYRLTEYMEKVFENVEFFNSVEKVNSLKTKVKALSKKIKKRKASKELADSLNELTLIDPTYLSLEEVKLYESVLDNASKLFTSPVADLYDGIATRLGEASTKAKEQYQALKEIRVNANKLTDSYKKAKIKSLIGQLEDSGVPKEVLETMTKDKSLDEVIQDLGKQLEADLDSAGNPSKVKQTQREILSDVYEYLREEAQSNLEDYKDSLTKQEFDLLESLLSLGADELSDSNLFQAIASLRNLSINGSVEGLGKIAAKAQLINNLKDKTKVDNFNEGFRQSSKIGRMLRSNFTSGTTYLRSLLRNEKYAGKVLGLLGISQFQESSAKAFRKIEATVKEVEDLFKKYKTLADPYKISEITILADLVSYREGWTDEEIQENFQKQKDQLKQTIEGEEAQSKLDDEYAEANKDSIKDLKDIYESVKDLTLEEAQKRLDNLDGGAKELYDLVRAKFDEIKEQAMFVSKQFGGNSFEKGWVNYIPSSFF